VDGLEAVAAKIAELIESDPQRVCALYEAFLAGCTAKALSLRFARDQHRGTAPESAVANGGQCRTAFCRPY
jgi:hypothetical protein